MVECTKDCCLVQLWEDEGVGKSVAKAGVGNTWVQNNNGAMVQCACVCVGGGTFFLSFVVSQSLPLCPIHHLIEGQKYFCLKHISLFSRPTSWVRSTMPSTWSPLLSSPTHAAPRLSAWVWERFSIISLICSVVRQNMLDNMHTIPCSTIQFADRPPRWKDIYNLCRTCSAGCFPGEFPSTRSCRQSSRCLPLGSCCRCPSSSRECATVKQEKI